jgi:DNA-binding winged helix-turn-helix (wHTH) protein/TolB-like protein/Tfp pilus assembly protein PilF
MERLRFSYQMNTLADQGVARRLQIGEWWVDPTTNELGRPGSTVRIEPKAMEVLVALAERAGQAVTREELLAGVWPGVVVGDEALTQSIIKLRRALGDDPRSPSYIETISKRGYRLIAPVHRGEGPPSPSPLRRGRALGLAAGAVLALGAAGAYLYVYGWLRPPIPPVPDAFVAGDRKEVLTVTVLPFEALGTDVGQMRLAAGIGSDLMTDLSRLPGLRLIAASGAAQSGRFVVSGSVQREASALRVNVRLTDSRTSEQLWSQRFERPVGDLFAIQNEISRSLGAQLPGRIGDAERRRIAKRYTHSLEAYEHFLRGQAQLLARQGEEYLQARASYEKAIELDPKFARAYAGLAMTYAMDRRQPTVTQSSAALKRALELAETARQIDPDIPEVHWALGFVHTRGRRHDEAKRALHRAIELNPSYADAYALLGGIHTYIGEPAKSVPLLRSALRLNPDGGYLYYLLLGRAYLFMDDFEQAQINLQEALLRNPVDVESRVYLAATLAALGKQAAAGWEADEIRSLEPGFSARAWLETYPLTSARHRDRLLALTAKVGL